MKKIYVKLIIFFCLILSSCLKENIPLSSVREDYHGDNLRIDGLYYQKRSDGYIHIVEFYYRNGIKFEISFSGEITNPADLVSKLTKEIIESNRKRKYNWGIFKINGNDFLSEQWETPIHGNYFATITLTGEILSDTSFILTKGIFSQGITEMNDKRYFYPFSPKPDSTNNFIK